MAARSRMGVLEAQYLCVGTKMVQIEKSLLPPRSGGGWALGAFYHTPLLSHSFFLFPSKIGTAARPHLTVPMSSLLRKLSSMRLPQMHSLPECRPLQDPSIGVCLIAQLPPELVLEVASWLPVSSAANLALCNRWLFTLLRRSSFDLLNGHDVNHLERTSFLKALSRDIVDSFFCYSCRELHYLRQDYQ